MGKKVFLVFSGNLLFAFMYALIGFVIILLAPKVNLSARFETPSIKVLNSPMLISDIAPN